MAFAWAGQHLALPFLPDWRYLVSRVLAALAVTGSMTVFHLVRGGSLLVLGGARSFGEGGYGGTPVADALPLVIDPRTRASEPSDLARLQVFPTRAGQSHASTQIANSECGDDGPIVSRAILHYSHATPRGIGG